MPDVTGSEASPPDRHDAWSWDGDGATSRAPDDPAPRFLPANDPVTEACPPGAGRENAADPDGVGITLKPEKFTVLGRIVAGVQWTVSDTGREVRPPLHVESGPVRVASAEPLMTVDTLDPVVLQSETSRVSVERSRPAPAAVSGGENVSRPVTELHDTDPVATVLMLLGKSVTLAPHPVASTVVRTAAAMAAALRPCAVDTAFPLPPSALSGPTLVGPDRADGTG